MKRFLLSVLFGVVLGVSAVIGPAFKADMQTYGVDMVYTFNEMQCVVFANAVIPEVAMAKRLGVGKGRYMTYLQSEATGPRTNEQRRAGDQFLSYTDQVWESADGGFKVIDLCFKRAAEARQKKSAVES